ncbi:hypothetical protein BBJ28_00016873 [Nothophytophthora sp. Chile5]|nr:hypothetical protein BBJ28_00016873 [Nothophytophthora sp. Chile5]
MLSPVAQEEVARIDMSVLSEPPTGGGRSSGSDRRAKSSRAGAQAFRSCSAFPEYFSRVLDYRQMDLDATFYQMVTLCVQPAKVYKSAYYRKQTKNRWARDDPAFAAIQFAFLLVATAAWALAFRVSSAAACLSLLFHAVVVEWLGFGLVVQGMGDTLYVEQRVEWQFAFDIHCNAFFILFLFLYVLQVLDGLVGLSCWYTNPLTDSAGCLRLWQFLLAPLLASESFLMLAVGNMLYSLAWGFYTYITFLGYMGTYASSEQVEAAVN